MEKIDKYLEIVEELNLTTYYAELLQIKERIQEKNAEIIIPFVGEFSSGKTSLINSLSDYKLLETAAKATTSSIYEIRYGSETIYADIFNKDGSINSIENPDLLKNDELKESNLVRIYDTSMRIPKSTVIVDTPGLSSTDIEHKLSLSAYLPKSDVIFLVTDINQQITRSLIDFIKDAKYVMRPIYLVVTKIDTKTATELLEVKEYINKQASDLGIKDVAYTSSQNGDISELIDIISEVQSNKDKIINDLSIYKLNVISEDILENINTLLETSKSSAEIDKQIDKQNHRLREIQNYIEGITSKAKREVVSISDKYSNEFRDRIVSNLDNIVIQKGINHDFQVKSSIASFSDLILNNYKIDVGRLLSKIAKDNRGKADYISINSIESIDFSNLSFKEFAYSLNLSELGHEYDKHFAIATKVLGAGAAIALAVATAGAAAGAVGEAATTSGAAISTGVSVADTATDIISINKINNFTKSQKIKESIRKGEFTQKTIEKYNEINKFENEYGHSFTSDKSKGFVESIVSGVTDGSLGKPQRRRAILNFVNSSLLPEFRSELIRLSNMIINEISLVLQTEAETKTNEVRDALLELKEMREKDIENYNQKKLKLMEMKSFIINNQIK